MAHVREYRLPNEQSALAFTAHCHYCRQVLYSVSEWLYHLQSAEHYKSMERSFVDDYASTVMYNDNESESDHLMTLNELALFYQKNYSLCTMTCRSFPPANAKYSAPQCRLYNRATKPSQQRSWKHSPAWRRKLSHTLTRCDICNRSFNSTSQQIEHAMSRRHCNKLKSYC